MSRPTVYTPELGALICEKLAECGSLRRVCADHEMPLERTVRRWYTENEAFASAYARAKEAGIDALVEEALDITDEAPPSNQHGGVDTGHVAWAKNRREYRQWLAERMAPKRYGLKTATELTGANGGAIKTLVVTTGVPDNSVSIDDLV